MDVLNIAMTDNRGWIGVDLDGTLAEYHGWVDITHIGKPVPNMVKIVQEHLSKGDRVKIFTARASDERNKEEVVGIIQRWCLEHLGTALEVTNVKDFKMILLYDDRCRQVVENTGVIVGQ